MKGYVDEKTRNLIYDISIKMDKVAAEIQFIETTIGWKRQHQGGDWWAVALPRAQVSGKITIQQETIIIQGRGYHDHNWNVKIFALKNIGWHWGKIYSDHTAITWSKILRTTVIVQPILVINTLHNGYVNVPLRNLRITEADISEENGRLIPHEFILDAETDTITLHVTMKTVDIHYVKFFPFMHYWRYHVKCIGSVIIDSETESINNLFIAEFLKFH